jgi:PAS domain S-box-containing protein
MEDCQEKAGMQNETRRIVDALPGLVWSALPDGQIDFLNQRWCEYAGLSLEEACGWGWQVAVHPEDLPELLVRWQSILASGESGEMVARLRRFDGAYRWFHISASPLSNAAGEIVKWYGVSTDIEDRRRAEEALRVRELDFRLIVDSLSRRLGEDGRETPPRTCEEFMAEAMSGRLSDSKAGKEILLCRRTRSSFFLMLITPYSTTTGSH